MLRSPLTLLPFPPLSLLQLRRFQPRLLVSAFRTITRVEIELIHRLILQVHLCWNEEGLHHPQLRTLWEGPLEE